VLYLNWYICIVRFWWGFSLNGFREIRRRPKDCLLRHGIDQRRPLRAPHTRSNLHHRSYHDLQKNTPLSTVAHYAQQQQRPATSVAWRRLSVGGSGNSGNLVAVGSVGCGNYGTFASNITVGEDVVAHRGPGLSTRQTFWGAAQSGGVAGVSSSLTSLHLSQTMRSPAVTTEGGSGGDPDFSVIKCNLIASVTNNEVTCRGTRRRQWWRSRFYNACYNAPTPSPQAPTNRSVG
jgi:hypothetical protein